MSLELSSEKWVRCVVAHITPNDVSQRLFLELTWGPSQGPKVVQSELLSSVVSPMQQGFVTVVSLTQRGFVTVVSPMQQGFVTVVLLMQQGCIAVVS